MKTRLIATGVVAAALVLGAQTSAFAYAPPVTPDAGTPGSTVTYVEPTGQPGGTPATVTLTGDQASEEASITMASTYVSSGLSVKDNGQLAVAIKLPTSAPVGSTYTMAIAAGSFTDSVAIKVAAAPVDSTTPLANTGGGSSTGGDLASTGVNSTPFVWFGGGLLVLGAGLVAVLAFVRRSRSVA